MSLTTGKYNVTAKAVNHEKNTLIPRAFPFTWWWGLWWILIFFINVNFGRICVIIIIVLHASTVWKELKHENRSNNGCCSFKTLLGKISEASTKGTGPHPSEKNAMYAIKLTTIVRLDELAAPFVHGFGDISTICWYYIWAWNSLG